MNRLSEKYFPESFSVLLLCNDVVHVVFSPQAGNYSKSITSPIMMWFVLNCNGCHLKTTKIIFFSPSVRFRSGVYESQFPPLHLQGKTAPTPSKLFPPFSRLRRFSMQHLLPHPPSNIGRNTFSSVEGEGSGVAKRNFTLQVGGFTVFFFLPFREGLDTAFYCREDSFITIHFRLVDLYLFELLQLLQKRHHTTPENSTEKITAPFRDHHPQLFSPEENVDSSGTCY